MTLQTDPSSNPSNLGQVAPGKTNCGKFLSIVGGLFSPLCDFCFVFNKEALLTGMNLVQTVSSLFSSTSSSMKDQEPLLEWKVFWDISLSKCSNLTGNLSGGFRLKDDVSLGLDFSQPSRSGKVLAKSTYGGDLMNSFWMD